MYLSLTTISAIRFNFKNSVVRILCDRRGQSSREKTAFAQVVYSHPNNNTERTSDTPGLKALTILKSSLKYGNQNKLKFT